MWIVIKHGRRDENENIIDVITFQLVPFPNTYIDTLDEFLL